MAGAIPDSNSWRRFRDEFQVLANEEKASLHTTRKDDALRAYCTYEEHPEIIGFRMDARWAFVLFNQTEDPHIEGANLIEKTKTVQAPFCLIKVPKWGLWTLSGGVNENFRERLLTLATRAGIVLGSPTNTEPLGFWLHWLFLDLLENKSKLLFAAKKNEGGIVLSVSEGSAIFCSRLERKALEAAASAAVPPESSQTDESLPFSHSIDYRSVVIHGIEYSLTARQAQIVQILHEANVNGHTDISIAQILEQIETPNGRWQDTFRTNVEAKKALIASGGRKGTLRLNL